MESTKIFEYASIFQPEITMFIHFPSPVLKASRVKTSEASFNGPSPTDLGVSQPPLGHLRVGSIFGSQVGEWKSTPSVVKHGNGKPPLQMEVLMRKVIK